MTPGGTSSIFTLIFGDLLMEIRKIVGICVTQVLLADASISFGGHPQFFYKP